MLSHIRQSEKHILIAVVFSKRYHRPEKLGRLAFLFYKMKAQKPLVA